MTPTGAQITQYNSVDCILLKSYAHQVRETEKRTKLVQITSQEASPYRNINLWKIQVTSYPSSQREVSTCKTSNYRGSTVFNQKDTHSSLGNQYVTGPSKLDNSVIVKYIKVYYQKTNTISPVQGSKIRKSIIMSSRIF